jgi:hypothetical protein
MKRTDLIYFIITLFSICESSFAQDWHFKLKSKVELRNWNLSSRAMKSSIFLSGASVKLYKNSSLIQEIQSDAEGNFEMNIPADGEYTLIVSYQGQPEKKFAISTKSKAPDNNAGFKPTISMTGVIMSKHMKDAKYLGLTPPHVMIEYTQLKTEEKQNYHFKSNIYDAEYLLIQKFCTASKLGDLALQRKDYDQAKGFYLMAMGILDSETYPKDQLKRAEEGLNAEKANKALVRRKSSQNTSKQAIVSKQENAPSVKKSVETGKSTRKTRQTLGK